MLRSALAPSCSQTNPAGLVGWEARFPGCLLLLARMGEGALFGGQKVEVSECWPLGAAVGVSSSMCVEVPAGADEWEG